MQLRLQETRRVCLYKTVFLHSQAALTAEAYNITLSIEAHLRTFFPYRR